MPRPSLPGRVWKPAPESPAAPPSPASLASRPLEVTSAARVWPHLCLPLWAWSLTVQQGARPWRPRCWTAMRLRRWQREDLARGQPAPALPPHSGLPPATTRAQGEPHTWAGELGTACWQRPCVAASPVTRVAVSPEGGFLRTPPVSPPSHRGSPGHGAAAPLTWALSTAKPPPPAGDTPLCLGASARGLRHAEGCSRVRGWPWDHGRVSRGD